jgi:uncharacterized protein YbjT (DUF2867 family)
MRVVLTGATGFIGSHILTELQEHGHEVTALVREDPDVISARGATPAVVDLYDRDRVVKLLRQADAAIHTASPGDETSANLDAAVADAAIEAFTGTGKPYSTSAASGSTARTPRSLRHPRSTLLPSSHGRIRSSAGFSTPSTCAAW